MLMSALGELSNPRAKVTSLLKKGVIIRVKKGLYIFGDEYRQRPFSRELLANLVYGPSFVSLEYALSFHGMIPERAEVLTSVTPKRPKHFDTPVGTFVYRRTPRRAFHLGIDRVESQDVAFLIASPERALADTLRETNGTYRTQQEMARLLFDDLRIDRSLFSSLSVTLLKKLAESMKSVRVRLAVKLLGREKR